MPNPRDGEFGKMPHYCPGGWVLLELTDTLWENWKWLIFAQKMMQTEVGSLKFLKATKWFAKINIIKNGEAIIQSMCCELDCLQFTI